MKKPHFWCGLLVFAIGTGFASLGLRESLWVDEIHTSWVVAGSETTLSLRAAAGNQTPVFFLIEELLCATLGHSEATLRLPALLSFGFSLALCLWIATSLGNIRRAWLWALGSVIAWVVLDRIQLFYATEARVYGLLQFLSLAAWVLVAKLIQLLSSGENVGNPYRKPVIRCLALWAIISAFAVNLHLISALVFAWQWACISVAIGFAARNGRWRPAFFMWLTFSGAVLIGCLPSLLIVRAVWNRREQWASFAGDASFTTLLNVFPILPIGLPVLVVLLVEAMGRWWSVKPLRRQPDGRTNAAAGIWLVAAFAPLFTAWALTYFEFAPVLHRRYVICCAFPFVLVCIAGLMRIRLSWVRAVVLVAGCFWLTYSQHSLAIWSSGEILGWQRGEDWKSAAVWVSWQNQLHREEAKAELSRQPANDRVLATGVRPAIWCISGLIEAKGATTPLDSDFDAYLSFPLRGLYRVYDGERRFVQPHALVGGWQDWLSQIRSEKLGEHFIFFRGNLNQFKSAMNKMVEHSDYQLGSDTRAFGLVCVGHLRAANTMSLSAANNEPNATN